jgi:outer membrane protein
MNTQRMWWIAAVSLVMVGGTALAQQPQQVTFAQAIDIALKQNLTVKQAEYNLIAQQATADQAPKNLLPNLQISLGNTNAVGQQFNLSTGKLTTQTTRSLSPGLGGSVVLYNGNQTYANIASARDLTRADAADLTRTRQTAVFNVASDFVALVNAQSQLDVQKENLASSQVQLDQIQQFANAGARPISDLYQQRATVASAQLAVVQAEQQVDLAKINLIQALQLDPAKEYTFVAPVIPDAASTRAFSLDSLVAVAYAKRPEIISDQQRVLAAAQDMRAARGGRLPTVRATFNYGSAYTSASDSGVFNQFNQRRTGSLGFSLSVPIFDNGTTRLAEERAVVEVENARLTLITQQQSVALDVRRALLNVRSAQQQLVAASAQQLAAQQALDAVQQRYNVGAATLIEITQARSQLVNAESAMFTAKYTLVLNQAVLAYYTGELDPANIKLGVGG